MKDLKKIRQKYFEGRKIFDEESVKESEAFCMLPWVHLYISQFGTVAPCCVTPWEEDNAFGNVNKNSVNDIWHGEPIKKMRANMLKDKKDSRCWQCYENEAAGIRSHRKIANWRYIHQLDWVKTTKANGDAPDSKPIYLDIRISNLCNFKCRICGHNSSSKWYDDAKALGELAFDKALDYSIEDVDDVLAQLTEYADDIEEIVFAGGEPVLMEEHYKVLDFLKKHNRFDVQLRYITNFSETAIGKKDIFNEWKTFTDVNVHASLDGMGLRGEMQRKGQDWKKTVENRERMLRELPDVNFMVQSTINIFNVLHIPDFHKKWVEEGLVKIDSFLPHTLKYPNEFCIKILPPEMKKEVAKKYKEHLKWLEASGASGMQYDYVHNEYKHTISFMNSEDWTDKIPQFRNRCKVLDELRQESTVEACPELEPLLKE